MLEDLRKAELLLDTTQLELLVAHSLVVVEGNARVAGSFAYLEPLRRMKERKGEVTRAEFRDTIVQVFGASAIATYRIDKVWKGRGTHLRMKSHYRENPLVGMSSAVFEIPKSRKVVVSGGCEICAWSEDNFPDDAHYSFRIIRVTVVKDGG